jgi:hypothetical protein
VTVDRTTSLELCPRSVGRFEMKNVRELNQTNFGWVQNQLTDLNNQDQRLEPINVSGTPKLFQTEVKTF